MRAGRHPTKVAISDTLTPNNIDLTLVVSADHDFSMDFNFSAYNILSKQRVRQRLGFDLLAARAGSEEYQRYAEFFQQVRLGNRDAKKA